MTFREKVESYKAKIQQDEIENRPIQDLFQACKASIQIKDVVDRYTELKPAGNYLKGLCPFKGCGEKESFTVSAKEIFYCFECHKGGDVISFIATMKNISQLDAVEWIVKLVAHRELHIA